ncbi:hypothetical protein WK78_23740 [Burkholderia cepacia]|nr:hypothetical protein WK78_23740 [Burkholderia cepacia]KWB14461.1 hypothetical protein WL32_33845 [Burkholderia cepacia]
MCETALLIAPIVRHSHCYATPVIHAQFQASFQLLAPDKFDSCTHGLGGPWVVGFTLCRRQDLTDLLIPDGCASGFGEKFARLLYPKLKRLPVDFSLIICARYMRPCIEHVICVTRQVLRFCRIDRIRLDNATSFFRKENQLDQVDEKFWILGQGTVKSSCGAPGVTQGIEIDKFQAGDFLLAYAWIGIEMVEDHSNVMAEHRCSVSFKRLSEFCCRA